MSTSLIVELIVLKSPYTPEPTSRFLCRLFSLNPKPPTSLSTNGIPSLKINMWWFWELSLVDISIAWCGFGETYILTMGCEVIFTLKNYKNLNTFD